MRSFIYPFTKGLLWGLIPLGLFDLIAKNVPYLKQRFYDNPTLVWGFHFHHSLIGLASIGWGSYAKIHKSNNASFWLGLGVGIIVSHTLIDCRLIFIEKVKQNYLNELKK